ncbi:MULTISPECIES: hypothetical protein [unclassified Bradyrhizobium]|uniref:hypothetical protein n=1 Tax=unclassified Bradyrhizobium TaxID=2631580 RepID=UPI002306054B|nr:MULTISPECIES: hypothetical protein [unclassified Bradyrhizobium]
MTKDLLNIKSFDRRRVLQGIAGGLTAAGSTTLFAPALNRRVQAMRAEVVKG